MGKTPPEAQVATGARLRRWRVHRGVFQEALANAADVGQTAISNYEQGSRAVSVTILLRLAVALDVSFEDLLNTDPPDSEGGSP